MFSKLMRTSAVAPTFAVILGLGVCADDSYGRRGVVGSPPTTRSSTSAQATPSAPSTPTSSGHDASDVFFAPMMNPYDQQAVGLSNMILSKRGIDPHVTDLARQIKGAQTSDITQERGRLAGWGSSASPSMDMRHDLVGGTVARPI